MFGEETKSVFVIDTETLCDTEENIESYKKAVGQLVIDNGSLSIGTGSKIIALNSEAQSGIDSSLYVTKEELATSLSSKANSSDLLTVVKTDSDNTFSGSNTFNGTVIVPDATDNTQAANLGNVNTAVNTQISASVGTLTDLTTTAQNNVVAAINEIKSSVDSIQTNVDGQLTASSNIDFTGNITFTNTPSVNGSNVVLQSELESALASKADSSNVLTLSGGQTVAGTTTLEKVVLTGNITEDGQAATKKYVDDLYATLQSSLTELINAKANSSDVYAKTETYSKTEVDTAINNVNTQVSTNTSDISTLKTNDETLSAKVTALESASSAS